MEYEHEDMIDLGAISAETKGGESPFGDTEGQQALSGLSKD